MRKDIEKSELKATSKRIGLIARVLKASWQVRKKVVLVYAAGAVLETFAFIVSIYATAQVAALLAAYSTGDDAGRIWFWLGVDIASLALVAIGMWLMSTSKRLLYYSMVQWATTHFHAALSRLDIDDFYDETVRNQINKAQDGYSWQVSNFTDASLDLLYALLRFLATAVVVSQIVWWLIPLLALFLIPSLISESRLAKVQWGIWFAEGDTRHVFWGLENQLRTARHQMELRSSQARDYVTAIIQRINKRFFSSQEKEFSRANRIVLPAQLLDVIGTAIGSIYLLRQFLVGAIPLDRYFFLSGALLRIGSALNNIFGTLSRMQDQFLFMADFFAIVDRQPHIVDKPGAVMLPETMVPEIVFNDISFTYPGHTIPVFKHLTFTIRPGERLALVGENGAGKSTLIKLLLRFYRPTGGKIMVGGRDLQDVAIESWYTHLATLFQDFNQYPLSIKENIEIARQEFSGDKQRLKKAASMSNVDKFVKPYKYGWDTVLDNSFKKGVEPSGGQWQRVALARAFYRDASVLILDEPTAAIDAKAEYDIFNNIFDHYKGKTAIIVSHRFSTVRKADRILVLEHGKIVEDGTHQSLMKLDGQYADMFNKQAEGYR